MIENRSRRWSFQFIILPLLRDDSSALKPFSRLWVLEGGAEKSGVMPAEPTYGRGLGRKITVFRKPSGIPNPATRELVHSSHVHGQTLWRAGKGLRQVLEKFLQFFDKVLHPPIPPPLPLPRVLKLRYVTATKSGSLRHAKHHTSLL